MSNTCDAKLIQQNTAQSKVDQAKAEYSTANLAYLSCLGPTAAGDHALETTAPAMNAIQKEVDSISYMQKFILSQLKRESLNGKTIGILASSAQDEEEKLRTEIDAIKSEIRTEKRKFLDASPSSSTAVAGLYYTMQPDNQVLIAFITCFCAFLLFTGLMVIMNKIPGGYIIPMSMGERIKVVVSAWVLILVVTYIFFFALT